MVYYYWGCLQWEGTPLLRHGKEVCPPFLRFSIQFDPILLLHAIWLTPAFCRKNRFVSITFSSRDILDLNLINCFFFFFFQPFYLLNSFKAFWINALFVFQSNWPPFSLILDHFDLSFLQKFFITCRTRLPKICWSLPPGVVYLSTYDCNVWSVSSLASIQVC